MQQQGFTLVELLITIAIIGVLAAVAVPQYNDFTDRATYSEVVLAASALKQDIAICGARQGGLNNCSGGANGVPANVATGSDPRPLIDTITIVGASGANDNTTGTNDSTTGTDDSTTATITIKPNAVGGITADDVYTLVGTMTGAGTPITWVGTCTNRSELC